MVVHFAVTGVNPQATDLTTGADGKVTFSYTGTTMGDDTVVVSATITTTPITLDPVAVQWGTAIGTPWLRSSVRISNAARSAVWSVSERPLRRSTSVSVQAAIFVLRQCFSPPGGLA